MNKVLLSVVGAGLFASAGVQAADVRLMVEPSYPPDQAAEVYKPLLDYLKAATGHNITLVTPRNYHFFWREIRSNAPIDMVFAEAHFTDYRITKFKAEPLVRAADTTSYTLVVHAALILPVVAIGSALLWREGLSLVEVSRRAVRLGRARQASTESAPRLL